MIEVSPFSLPLVRPFVSAKGTTTHREGWLVRVHMNGLTGIGEASPMPGLCSDSPEQIQRDLGRLTSIAEAPPSSIQDLDRWVCNHASTAVVRHALGSAVVDIMAQMASLPVARILNTQARSEVPVSHLYTDDDALFHATMLGCQTVKVKVGVEPLSNEIEKVTAIRGIVGPDIDIRLDANGAWSEEDAHKAIESFRPLGVRTIEDPVATSQFAAMARLRGSGIDIAADEAVTSMGTLKGLLAASAIDAIVVKPMRIGTPMAALELIDEADRNGIATIVTTTIDGAIGRMMALHIAAAAPTSKLRACGLNTGGWLASDTATTPDMAGSHVDTPTSPGLGLR